MTYSWPLSVWNLVTSKICGIEVPDFVSMDHWYGYTYSYNFSAKNKQTDEAIFSYYYILLTMNYVLNVNQ